MSAQKKGSHMENRGPDVCGGSAERSFFERVYALVAQIPAGRVASYGQLAWLLGAPRAARQVGWAMRRCPDTVPWQRVVKQDGTVAGGGYAELRRALLQSEGAAFLPDGRVDMEKCRWNGSV
jgi:methylated-DNA-protein-cysteine methyltransferase-like protein